MRRLLVYAALGSLFGVVLVQGEVISWFRIQEMFRFQGYHMYGIFATAVPVAMLGVQLIRRTNARSLDDQPITIPPKSMGSGIRFIAGRTLFGIGWALTGACPGPFFALLGSGIGVMALVILSALAGTWTYGWLRPRLPH
jgi:uncharacterized protein